MDWDKLKSFHAAAEAGSLTGAAEALRLSQSAVSRQIAALEDDLGVKLFHRHARGLIPTEPGQLLYKVAHDISAKVALAEAMVTDSRDKPSGDLRVTAPIAMGSIWLAPRLAAFNAAYPDIRIHLMLDDRELDIAGLEADCAIRPWPSTQNDLIQRKLMNVRQHMYAGRAYLERRGTPQSVADLDQHSFIHYGPPHLAPIPHLDWAAKAGLKSGAPMRPATVEANSIMAIVKAAEAGLGIAGLPDYVTRDNDRLMRILPETEGPAFEVYFVYPSELRGTSRVTAFRNFVIAEARRDEA
tara:strand:- start:411 stop:1304 length:894 start_codon:yes stop_codon:yes gene_type:complete